jgi:hypothetical protein
MTVRPTHRRAAAFPKSVEQEMRRLLAAQQISGTADMTRSEIILRIEDLTKSDPGTLRGPEALEEVGGFDSLFNELFRIMAEELLGVELDGLAVEKCATVDDLIDLLGDAVADDR